MSEPGAIARGLGEGVSMRPGDLSSVRESRELSRPPGIEVRIDPASSALLVAFSGLRPVSGTHYDFRRVTDSLNASRVLVRDHERSWYHRGVRGVGSEPESILHFLQQAVSSINPDRVVMTGASAGGYAAMLFGELASADEVHAFAPQTLVGLEAMRQFREPRWLAEGRRMREDKTLREEFADLASVLGTTDPRSKPIHHIWFDPTSKPDSVHVGRIRKLERTRLHHLASGDHDVAYMLQGRGDLREILDRALRGCEPPLIVDELSSVDLPDKVPRLYLARRRARIGRNRVMVRLGKEPRKYY
jgi:hypothetical protein